MLMVDSEGRHTATPGIVLGAQTERVTVKLRPQADHKIQSTGAESTLQLPLQKVISHNLQPELPI